MQNLSLKAVAIGVVALGIIIFGIFYFVDTRGKRTPETYINPAFSEYITSYTAGVVSSNSPIRVILASEAVDSSLIGEPSSVKG